MSSKVLLATLLWLVSLLLLGLVNLTSAVGYDSLPGWLLLLQVGWALAQLLGLVRLIYCL